MSKPFAADVVLELGQKSGKQIISSPASSVTVTFSGGNYANATGADGYTFLRCLLFRSDGGDPIGYNVTTKTVSGFTVTFQQEIASGELDWATKGTLA